MKWLHRICPCVGCDGLCCQSILIADGDVCDCGITTLDNGMVIRVVRVEPEPLDKGMADKDGYPWAFNVGPYWVRPFLSRHTAITTAYQQWDG